MVGVRMSEPLEQAVDEAAECRDETETETARRAMELGLQQMGYIQEDQTALEIVCHEVTKFGMYSALVVLALALGTQLDGLAMVGAIMFLIGTLAYVIEINEPQITQRLRRLQG